MKVLVCSAWPYGHGLPHLGNLIGCLLSGDVFYRFYKLLGADVVHVSGTDMHGTRIEYVAQKKGITPRELAFHTHEKIKEILKAYEIEPTNYTHTESEVHKKFVQDFYRKAYEKGFLFKRKESRPYCRKCDRFLADRLIIGKCPYCGYENAYGNQCDACGRVLEPSELISPKCAFCGSDVSFKETEVWYFDYPRFKERLEELNLKSGWTDFVKKTTKQMLADLRPRAITRDIKWGIPFPLNPSKVIYVWAEAALGYVSACKEIGREDMWQCDTKHFYCIAKDNIPFHTIFFPAQLMVLGLHLPDKIAAVHYLTWEGGEKFSKSRGVGLWSDEALKLMPGVYWRFYLLYNRPETKDIQFSWQDLDKVINGVLVNNIVNFIYRALNLAKRIGIGKVSNEVREKVELLKEKVKLLVEDTYIGKALREICTLADYGNEYLQTHEPWETKDKNVVADALYMARALAILLWPYIPSISEKVLKMLGVEPTLGSIDEELKVVFVEKIASRIDVDVLKKKYEAMKNV